MNKYVVPLILAGNILFSWSFIQLRIPGVAPLSEVVMVLCFLTFNFVALLEEMAAVVCIAPFILWWVFCIGYAILGVPEYGPWALRDASQAVDSLFLIIGFNYARNNGNLNSFVKWAPWVIGLAVVNTLIAYSFRTQIAEISPSIITEHGESVPIFGAFDLGVTVLMWAATYLIITAPGEGVGFVRMGIAGALICYAIIMFQTRTGYLQLLSMFALLFLLRRSSALKLFSVLPVLAIAVVVIGLLGVKLSSRLGGEISMSFFVSHMAAIFGTSDSNHEAIVAAASGVDQRLEWWRAIFDKVTSDSWTLLTGLGYGFPLVPFANTAGIQVREPHNSIVSVFARSGLIGLSAFIWMHVELFRSALKSFHAAGALAYGRRWQNAVLWLIAFPLLLLAGAGGEDVLEKPFHAIPYYFCWGILLNMAYRLRPVSDPRPAEVTEILFVSPGTNV
jgi:hypothetical protein